MVSAVGGRPARRGRGSVRGHERSLESVGVAVRVVWRGGWSLETVRVDGEPRRARRRSAPQALWVGTRRKG
jgi:hypothetical protein